MLVILIHMFGKSYCACRLGPIHFQWLDTQGQVLDHFNCYLTLCFFLTGIASLESELSSDDYKPITLAIFGNHQYNIEKLPEKKFDSRDRAH